MKAFVIIATLFLAVSCSASYGALSSQYHTQDHYGQYSYGYADPNSQKHETRTADGVTHGAYSYVDGHGILQSVSYVADPHNGFRASGTNLPQGPAPVHPVAIAHAAPYAYAAAPYAYAAAPYHVPVLTAHGVPADTPEVAAAKAAHFAAHAAAHAGHHLYKRSLWGGHAAGWAPAPVIHNGVPVDTPEVQHAKAAHYAAHSKALAETHAAGAYAAPYAAPYAGHYNGAPADTPDVAHAKAAHFAAHAAARAGHPAPVHGGYHVPVIHNGVPVDTPEVQHAKAAHFAAVAKASASAYAAPDHYNYAPAASYAHGPYQGPIHIPVIQNGVPVEPAEVQHAKAAHLAALSAASHGGYDHGYDNGHWNDDGQYHQQNW